MWPFLCFTSYLFFIVAAEIETRQCRSADGNLGNCIRVSRCVALNSLADSNEPEVVSLLRRSACGFTSGGVPKVCCPLVADDIRTTSVRTTQTTRGVSPVKQTPKQTSSTSTTADPGSAECPPTLGLPTDDCCGVDVSWNNRIAGGSIVSLDEYPWLALLEFHRQIKYPDRVETRVETNCGGSLISARYVLTAAHCLTSSWGTPTNVRLAEYNTSSSPQDCVEVEGGGQYCSVAVVVGVESWSVHPGYQPEHSIGGNDIALLKLKENAPYTDFVQPICLPTGDEIEEGADLVVAGWGSDGKKFSEVKQSVTVPYVTNEACNAVYSEKTPAVRINDKQMCAGGLEGKDSCAGDSGGPLMLREGQTFSLVGVVSVGPIRCGSKGLPAVYTRVNSFRQWIVDNMR